jgi:aspartyl-tRNA synthetase
VKSDQTIRTPAGSLRREDVGRTVLLSGWVHRQRDFGELVFVNLRDRSGICQLVVDEARLQDRHLVEMAKGLRQEFVIEARGEVVERKDDLKNREMETGEIEVVLDDLKILSRSEPLPFTISDETTATEETRLRHRYLDLRRPVLTRNLMLRDRICQRIRRTLQERDFLEIETPILTASTPEGARDYLVPSRVHPGEFYALPQSPQIFKQLLMVSGLERYYQIARCFRDEDLRSDRQPEFTQIDIEASFIDEEFVFELIEELFRAAFDEVQVEIPTPFPRMTWHEAMDRFGADRPDTRFGMELRDLAAAVETIPFPPFENARGADGSVRGIAVPGAAGYSRKQLDELTEEARQLGGSGLVWIKFASEPSSSIKKFLSEGDYERLRQELGAEEEDLGLVMAGETLPTLEALGALRTRIAERERLIPPDLWNFLWVVDFPLFEFDRGDQKWYARHHPFTSPRSEDVDRIETDPAGVMARAYDVVLNGLELGGGSIRIHDPQMQRRMFGALGISEKEAERRFGFLLDAFRYGAPPHGGIALGLDRVIMLMAGASSIRDVMAFPKTTSGQDLMTNAPSRVDDVQLRELSIRVDVPPKE